MVVVAGVIEPGLDALSLGMRDAIGRSLQRQLAEMGIVERQVPLQTRRTGGKQAVREHHIQLQNPVVVLMPEEALLTFNRHDTAQVRIGLWRTHDLRERIVGLSKHTDPSVTPGLRTRPLLCVEDILRLIDVRIPLSFRPATSSAIGQNTHVSALRHHVGDPRWCHVITHLQQHRKTPRGKRSPHFCGKCHTIAQRYPHVLVHQHAIRKLNWGGLTFH